MQTSDLERMIKRTKNLNMAVIEANPPPTFSEYVISLMEEKDIKRSRLIRALNMDRNYGYQILNGTRIPTRQQILHMALFMGLDVAQTRKLLTLGQRETLYVRRPEDAKIVHCLEHKVPYDKACDFIWGNE